jgi:hypothetical protein
VLSAVGCAVIAPLAAWVAFSVVTLHADVRAQEVRFGSHCQEAERRDREVVERLRRIEDKLDALRK